MVCPSTPENIPGDIPRHFWQRRFYDFNIFTDHKRIEKLRYIHRNPVKRGLVGAPEEWRMEQFSRLRFRRSGPSAHQ